MGAVNTTAFIATNPLATLSGRHKDMPLNRSRRCEPSRTGGSKSTTANAPVTASVGRRRSRFYRGDHRRGASTFGEIQRACHSCGLVGWVHGLSLLVSRLTQGPLLDEWCSYSLKQKPKTRCYFEDSHRRIERVQVNRLAEVGENDESESRRRAPYRRDHTPGSQSSRDIVRPKPQVAANCGCQSIKRQANVIGVEIRAEV